jgi:sulfite reductase (ferredoxin)
MSKLDVEALKRESRGLRGDLPEELAAATDHFGEGSVQLLKYHGIYQQDDRDARKSARETGAGKDFSFMIRTKNPGGFLPAAFYLGIDHLADAFANGTIRVTTRGALQLHGVRKNNLKHVIAQINEHLGSTLGACGDINRNVMAPAPPYAAPAYVAAREAAAAIADLLTPRATAYYEVWQDDELVHTSQEPGADEPIYGATFLPRKFKIAVTPPGDNSVDLYTNDVGVVPLLDAAGSVTGYDLTVGGGLGMTHGKHATFARIADEFAYVPRERMLDAVRAIVIVQRDNGDRTNRKHARLKYLIADRGIAWFRAEVERVAGFALEPWRPLPAWTIPAPRGWNDAGDGTWFYALDILSGRVRDGERTKLKTALREIVAATGRDLVATPNQNLLVVGVTGDQRATIDAILARNGVADTADDFERRAMACPAMPTCGLALAEAERFLPDLLDEIRAAWAGAGLDAGAPTIRMTGCPNSCARPSMGEIGIIGVSADRYHVYVGGSAVSTRLNTLARENVRGAEIAGVLAPLFMAYARDARDGESFGDFSLRHHLDPGAGPRLERIALGG